MTASEKGSRVTNILETVIAFTSIACVGYYLLYGCNASPPAETEALREAYERKNEVLMNAHLTLDTTKLPEAFTGKALEMAVASVKHRKDFPDLISQDREVVGFRVVDYEINRAIIDVEILYRHISQDRYTGVRSYNPPLDKEPYVSIVRVEMVKEDGKWKMSRSIDVFEYCLSSLVPWTGVWGCAK